jgi:hypothetical protein
MDEWAGLLNIPCNFSVSRGVLEEFESTPDKDP